MANSTHVDASRSTLASVSVIFTCAQEDPCREAAFSYAMSKPASDTVAKQVAAGLGIVRHDETPKTSYATRVKDRDACGGSDGTCNAPAGVNKPPCFLKRLAGFGGTFKSARPTCASEVKSKGQGEPEKNIADFKAAKFAPSGTMSVQKRPLPALKPSLNVEASLHWTAETAIRREPNGAGNVNSVHKKFGAVRKISYQSCEHCSWRMECIP